MFAPVPHRPTPPAPLRIALLVLNDLSYEQRVHKVCLSLLAAGYAPTLVGVAAPGAPPLSPRPYATHRVALSARSGPLYYAQATRALLRYVLRTQPAIVTANDLDTLLAARVAAGLIGRPVVYDAHEFYTDTGELVRRPLARAVWRALEALLYPGLRHRLTVHAGIAALYRQRYARATPPAVVPNLPLAAPAPSPLPSAAARRLLYQGGVQRGRGLELALHALALLPHTELWVAGGGYHLAALQALASQLGVQGRVRWLGWVDFAALPALTVQASLGLSLEQADAPNLAHSAPNKLYDYLQARLPVVVAPRPVHRGVVEQWGCGRVMTADTPQALAHAVQALLADPAAYAEAQAGAERAAQALTWQAQAQGPLLEVYAAAAARV
jgi:glycosyltransferase involved in cell wall biosynthesis